LVHFGNPWTLQHEYRNGFSRIIQRIKGFHQTVHKYIYFVRLTNNGMKNMY
jgi:hypothetical protein